MRYRTKYIRNMEKILIGFFKVLLNCIRLSECVDIMNKIISKTKYGYVVKYYLNYGINEFLENYIDYVEGECKENFKLRFEDLSEFLDFMHTFVDALYTIFLLSKNDIKEIVNDIIVYCKFNEGVKDLIISAVKYELCEE